MSVNARTRYQQMDVLSMTPGRRVVLLYAHLLANLRQARRHLEAGDVERRNACLLKAYDIVVELLTSLDREQGGDLANRLASLYAFFTKEILEIDFHQDPERLDRLIQCVEPLHAAWNQAAEMLEADTPTSVPA